jgi:hypothetical protein
MLNAKWSHAIAVLLAVAGAILHFLQTTPDIATELHVTGNILVGAGFIIALASQQLFGTPTPPNPGPLAQPQNPVAAAAAKVAPLACLCMLLVGLAPACKGSVLPTAESVVGVIITDLQAGDTDAQIASDVCAALGGTTVTDTVCASVETVIQDVVVLLLDSSTLSPSGLARAQKYMADHPKVSK